MDHMLIRVDMVMQNMIIMTGSFGDWWLVIVVWQLVVGDDEVLTVGDEDDHW